jgi:hypothetical protein
MKTNPKMNQENLLVAIISCVMAIVAIIMMRTVLKLDLQSWAFLYIAAASTASIRWTMAGASLSVGSALRALACLMIGLFAIKFAGYPVPATFQTASLVPNEVMDALSHFHIYYDN